ncbi:BadF/BadG/BcrA/BcrD ATPase family protein [Oceaniglobus indicus]|uniref:BadF/BadG/BcrA/BcrD ATPase family protein n=1 Tax=Oceaniglobus indicus TaxID=2047749 RepID=UPI000C17CC08|nr:BadF/BadG/BcrA/BcrD ATPase family protein [Oceaniglobus indicus]
MCQQQAHHLVGVDGGGTGCRAVVCSLDGRPLGHGHGGPANATTDIAQAIHSVRTAVNAALVSAGLTPETAAPSVFAHIGLAGVLGTAQSEPVARAFGFARVRVTGDLPTSLAGALGEQSGALLAIGTGSLIAAQHGGAQRSVGGWGLQVSDQASGAWLGRALLEQVILCCDAMADHTPLTRETLARYPSGPADIVAFAATARPADYATLAPAIVAAAQAGDVTGRDLMQRGADYLGRAIGVLDLAGDDVLCLSGGVGPHYADFLSSNHRARLRPARGNALDGAALLARCAFATEMRS